MACDPWFGLSVAAHQADIDLGEVSAQRVLVAFEQHDVDIGVVTRDLADGKVDGPAASDPVGNGQVG